MRSRITFHWIRIWGMWQQSEARAKSSWTLPWKVKSCRQTLHTIECTNLVEALPWEGNLSRWWQASTKTTIFKIVSSSSSTTFCLSLFRHFSSSHLNAEWDINIRKTPLYSSYNDGTTSATAAAVESVVTRKQCHQSPLFSLTSEVDGAAAVAWQYVV